MPHINCLAAGVTHSEPGSGTCLRLDIDRVVFKYLVWGDIVHMTGRAISHANGAQPDGKHRNQPRARERARRGVTAAARRVGPRRKPGRTYLHSKAAHFFFA